MKIDILLLYLLITTLDSVPVRDRDEDDAIVKRHDFGPPDHIDGLPLERDGDLNTVSNLIAAFVLFHEAYNTYYNVNICVMQVHSYTYVLECCIWTRSNN